RRLSHRGHRQPRQRHRLLLLRPRGESHRGVLGHGPALLGAHGEAHRHRAIRRGGAGRSGPALESASRRAGGRADVRRDCDAQGGIQMEQGTIRFLKDRNYTLAGRKVELVVADTGGNPAGTKTKTQELTERDNVDMIFGPLAAFELLAITDYTAQAKMPVLSLAAAEDMTQRRPNPYFIRASA